MHRVALIGYGLAGEFFHAPLIASVTGLRLSAIVTSDPERQARARAAHPEAVLLDSPDELWKMREEIGLVVIATPNRSHLPLALAALGAALPVVVDKPLAVTAADARRLRDEAGSRGLMLTVFQNRRWDGDLLTLRRLIAEGRLGRVMRFESRFERWRPVPKPGWRENAAPEEAGGALYDLGAHLIDQALLLFGPVREVYAELERQRPGAQVDDDVFVALHHASGTRSHLWMSATAAHYGPRFRVLGSDAAYVKHGLDVQEARLRAGERPGGSDWGEEHPSRWGTLGTEEQHEPVPTQAGAWVRFYEETAAALRGSAPPPVDPDDAIATLEIIEAARRSNAERRIVHLTGD